MVKNGPNNPVSYQDLPPEYSDKVVASPTLDYKLITEFTSGRIAEVAPAFCIINGVLARVRTTDGWDIGSDSHALGSSTPAYESIWFHWFLPKRGFWCSHPVIQTESRDTLAIRLQPPLSHLPALGLQTRSDARSWTQYSRSEPALDPRCCSNCCSLRG